MDILRLRVKESGKTCRRYFRFFEERFKPWAASVLFHKHESTAAAPGFE